MSNEEEFERENVDAIWTYSIKMINNVNEMEMEFEYELDLGRLGSCGLFPEDFHDDIIDEIPTWFTIIPTFIGSSNVPAHLAGGAGGDSHVG